MCAALLILHDNRQTLHSIRDRSETADLDFISEKVSVAKFVLVRLPGRHYPVHGSPSSHQAIGCGLDVLPLLLARGTNRLHYTSLCVPDDLKERGLDKLPNCYYAQDALRVWNALHRCIKKKDIL